MNYQEYSPLALRTLSPTFDGDNVSGDEFYKLIKGLSVSGELITLFKRALFYGKPQEALTTPEGEKGLTSYFPHLNNPDKFNTLHALLGLIGESVELLQNLLGEDDSTNTVEEAGDLFWFMAVLTETNKLDVEVVWKANIAKLAARYPVKFDSDLSVNRDLTAEKVALETALGNTDNQQLSLSL